MLNLLLVCLLIFPGFAVQAQQPSAPAILKKMAAVYAACRTYADEGSISYKGGGLFSGRTAHFQTSFVRPDKFRYALELGGRNQPWIVWKNGELIRSSETFTVSDQDIAFDNALARMAPLSGGTSVAVPELLLPRVFRLVEWLTLIVNPTLTGKEKIDGHSTFRIEGTFWDQPVKLWIDESQYVIVRMY